MKPTLKRPPSVIAARVAPDGKLGFIREYDVETAGKDHYWMGMVGLG